MIFRSIASIVKIIAGLHPSQQRFATNGRTRRCTLLIGHSLVSEGGNDHGRPARLRADRRCGVRDPPVPAPDPQAPAHGRHCRRLLAVGGADQRQQRCLVRLLRAVSVLDGAGAVLLRGPARRHPRGHARPSGPGEGAACDPDQRLGRAAHRGSGRRRPRRPGNPAHGRLRAPGHPVDLDRLPNRSPHRDLIGNLDPHPGRTVVLDGLRRLPVRSPPHDPGLHRSRRKPAHAGPDPPHRPRRTARRPRGAG
jgi:hypothetical protein